MTQTVHSYEVASLFVDERNPRFSEPVGDQPAAINALLNQDPSKLINLARDIAVSGEVNPAELPIVLDQGKEQVVIEGNRRVAAIKSLRNPDIINSPELRQKFEEIAKIGVGPDQLLCAVVSGREDARHWIELRHTGENDGVGIVQWQSWQSNNFRRRPGTQADRAALFCSAVLNEYPENEVLKSTVESVRNQRLTTLGRLVADPEVRREFGFDFVNNQVVFHYRSQDIAPAMVRLFSDLASHLSVGQIDSKELRRKYINDSADTLPRKDSKLAAPRPPGAFQDSSAEAGEEPDTSKDSGTGSSAGTSRRQAPREEKVIFQGLRLPKVGLRTSKLLVQAQKVDINSAPAVAAILVRVIVELVVTDVSEREHWNIPERETLKKKIRTAILKLDPSQESDRLKDKSLEMVWLRSQGNQTGLTVQSMHAFVHNVMANPTAAEVRELSSTYRVLLERLDNYEKAQPNS